MSIEKQVCSIKSATRLNELGIKQDSLFYWIPPTNANSKKYSIGMIGSFNKTYHNYCISAFTTGELLKMVPQWIDTKKNEPFNFFNFFFCIKRIFIDDKLTRVYSVNYHCDTVQFKSESPFFAHTLFKGIYDTNPADALAKTILFLIENKLMGPEG
jgi:hypothetical protein